MYLFKPYYIIIHHSLTEDSKTVSWQPIRRYHMDTLKWKEIGYHYGIELINDKYEILIGRMEGTTGAHTRGLNRMSIGICLIGNYDFIPPNKQQWIILLKLCSNICLRYNISIDNVKGHKELTHYKSCPGNTFNMNNFRKDLKTITIFP